MTEKKNLSFEEKKSCLDIWRRSQFENRLVGLNLMTKMFGYLVFLAVHILVKDHHDYENMTELYFDLDKDGDTYLKRILYLSMGFAKWDGLMFLKIFHEGYDNLKLHAFFPGFPMVLRLITWPFGSIFGKAELTILVIFIGVLLNFMMHLANNVFIYRLAKLIRREERFARITGIIFAVGPSGFYHVIFYTESMYLFIYLSCLLYTYDTILGQKRKIGDLGFVRLTTLGLVFASAGFIRSVGFLSAAHICYPLLLELVEEIARKKILASLVKILKILYLSLMFLAPFFIIQVYVYNTYCHRGLKHASFCDDKIPNYYGYIQKEYWKVEPFSFIKQGSYGEAVFIILSFPVWLTFILKFTLKDFKRVANIATGFIPRFLMTRNHFEKIFAIFPNYVILLILGLFSFVSANLCSVDRFMSAIPYYYIILSDFYIWISPSKLPKYTFVYLLAMHYSFNIFSFASLWQPS